jgi:hypothetical protein
MVRKACIAVGFALSMGGIALADTPIGPGVTGAGGTGATTADSNLRAGAGGEAPVVRQDGMPADRADSNVRKDEHKGSTKRAAKTPAKRSAKGPAQDSVHGSAAGTARGATSGSAGADVTGSTAESNAGSAGVRGGAANNPGP